MLVQAMNRKGESLSAHGDMMANQLVLRIITRSLTPDNMTLNSQMAQLKSILPTLSLRKYLHRLMMKAEST